MTVFHRSRALALVLCATLPGFSPAFGAESPLPRALQDCTKETDSLRRLVCYDREVARAAAAAPPAAALPAAQAPATPAAAPVAAVAPVAPAAPAAGPVVQAQPAPAAAAAFGEEQVASRRKEREQAQEQSITAAVVSMKPWRPGANLLTLDNGQVWRQEEIESYFPLEEGGVVRIERGLLGSYHLTLVKEGWKKRTRVSRVR